jgi:hypothetical protein
MMEALATTGRSGKFSKAWVGVSRSRGIIASFFLLYLYFLVVKKLSTFIYDITIISEPRFGLNPIGSLFEINPREILVDLIFTLTFLVLTILVGHRFPGFMIRLLPKSGTTDVHRSKLTALEEAFANEIEYSENEAIVSNRLRAIAAIDNRVNALRGRSTWMLLSIGFLLITAAVTVIFAGSLTNLDVSAASDVDKISDDITKIETRLGRLSEIGELLKILSANGAAKEDKDRAGKRLGDILTYDRTLPAGQSGVDIEIVAAQTALQQDHKLLQDAWEKQLKAEHGYSDTRYLIATAITRIGVILVIVFLVQILIGLYRYNTRLITFYSSRYDALQLWDGKSATLEKLQKIMVPNIEFGKEPKHPIEDLMRQVIAKLHIGNIPGTGPSQAKS